LEEAGVEVALLVMPEVAVSADVVPETSLVTHYQLLEENRRRFLKNEN